MSTGASSLHCVQARGIRVEVDLAVGHLARMEIESEGRRIAPFHRAPWADDATAPEGCEAAPHLARLSGDFFCAPFAASDLDAAPAHGWPANAPWSLLEMQALPDGMRARYALGRTVLGATLVKELTLRDHHPFVYQRHVFRGGQGRLPVAHHAMVSLPQGGRMCFSPKRWAETPPEALEADPARGRSLLQYPAQACDLRQLPRADGALADLGSYPLGEAHEDLVMLVEAEGATLGWSAVLRPVERDMALTLKNPRQLPQTLLWFSNGGRHYAPWNGRHRQVLGVEEACSYGIAGHRASIAPNPLSDAGVPTSLALVPGGESDIRCVLGAMALPDWLDEVAEISTGPDALQIRNRAGRALALPFDTDFLTGDD